MNTDFKAALRRVKPERRLKPFVRRSEEDLTDADGFGHGRTPIVLDTNVYIRSAADTLPEAVEVLLDGALLYHCSVCIGELAVGVANAKPSHPKWEELRDQYAAVVASMPPSRVLTPDAQVWAEAGLVAGTLARTQNLQAFQRKEYLNDALIFLSAAKAGLPVLTSDREGFDLIQQICPQGRFVYY